MASASHALLRSLLRQSDRHPVGHLDGIDLDGADPGLIERLLARGVLREIRRLDRVGDLAVAQDGPACWALSVDGDEADQEIDPRGLRQFEIDPSALATFIAGAAGIAGPVEQVDRQLTSLGRLEKGTVATAVFLAWNLHDRSVHMVGRSIRQLVPVGPVILLTPTLRDLGLEASRALDERGIRQAAVDALLPPHPTAELHLDLITVLHGRPRAEPRLVVRQKARSVVLDGTNVVVPPQPFDLLVLLAGRALQDGTHANRRDIENTLFPGAVHGHDVSDIVHRLRGAFAPLVGGAEAAKEFVVNKPRCGYRLSLAPQRNRSRLSQGTHVPCAERAVPRIAHKFPHHREFPRRENAAG